jgi:hypothetical protein
MTDPSVGSRAERAHTPGHEQSRDGSRGDCDEIERRCVDALVARAPFRYVQKLRSLFRRNQVPVCEY